jgi:hypothetical protein
LNRENSVFTMADTAAGAGRRSLRPKPSMRMRAFLHTRSKSARAMFRWCRRYQKRLRMAEGVAVVENSANAD